MINSSSPTQYVNPVLPYADLILSNIHINSEETVKGSHWYCDPSIVTKQQIFGKSTTTNVGGTMAIDVSFVQSVQNSMFFCLVLDPNEERKDHVDQGNYSIVLVESGIRLRVDREHISKHSTVLKELIDSSSSSDELVIEEIGVGYLKEIVKFIHDGKLGLESTGFVSQNDEGLINLKQLLDLTKIADKYQVESLLREIARVANDMIAMLIINNCKNMSNLGKSTVLQRCYECIGYNLASVVAGKVYDNQTLSTDFVNQMMIKMHELQLTDEGMLDFVLQDYGVDFSNNRKEIGKLITFLKTDMTLITLSELDKETFEGILSSKYLSIPDEQLALVITCWVMTNPTRLEDACEFVLKNDWTRCSKVGLNILFYNVLICFAKKEEKYSNCLDKLRNKLSQTLFKIDNVMGEEWKIYNDGKVLRKIYDIPNEDIRVLLLGLDASGKTTILYNLKLGQLITTIPTIGFNVETVDNFGANMTIWDVGGQPKIRPLWRHYYSNTSIIVFTVDATDRERFDEACDSIQRLASDEELVGCPILILANKTDLVSSAPISEIVEKLELNRLKNKNWMVQACSAISGTGLDDGFRLVLKAKLFKDRNAASLPTSEETKDLPKITTHFGSFDLKSNHF